jgi:hypothetical protein
VTSLVVIVEGCSAVDRAIRCDVIVCELFSCSHPGGCDVNRWARRSDEK